MFTAALLGLGAFPAVRCNAPEFSAVVGADGRVAPCFFIPSPPLAPRAPDLIASLGSEPARALRAAIRAGLTAAAAVATPATATIRMVDQPTCLSIRTSN